MFTYFLLLERVYQHYQTTYTELWGDFEDFEKSLINMTIIYDSKILPAPADYIDCSFVCSFVEKSNGCVLFVMEEEICYVGKSSKNSSAEEINQASSINSTTLLENDSIFHINIEAFMEQNVGNTKNDTSCKNYGHHTLSESKSTVNITSGNLKRNVLTIL